MGKKQKKKLSKEKKLTLTKENPIRKQCLSRNVML